MNTDRLTSRTTHPGPTRLAPLLWPAALVVVTACKHGGGGDPTIVWGQSNWNQGNWQPAASSSPATNPTEIVRRPATPATEPTTEENP